MLIWLCLRVMNILCKVPKESCIYPVQIRQCACFCVWLDFKRESQLYRDPHNQGFHQHPTPSPGTCSTFLLLLTIHRQHGQAGTKMSTHRSSGASRSSLFLPAAPSLLSLHRIRGAGACVRKKNKRKCMPQGRKWKKGKSKRGREKEADLDGDQSSGA